MSTAAVKEAPVFTPTAEEWKEPLVYINSLRIHEHWGAVVVKPPPGWHDLPCAVDRFQKLPTQLLSVHSLQKETTAAEKQFWMEFDVFMEQSGASRLKKKPTLGGQEIDLYRLWRLVKKRGGYESVSGNRGWKEIVDELQAS